MQLQCLMRDAESDIAEQLCADAWLTVLDGALHGAAVKTERAARMEPQEMQVPAR